MLNLYANITKVDKEQRMVWGYATTDAVDNDGEIIKTEAVKQALPDYLKFGNIREMHQASAVGVVKEADMTENGLFIGAKIVDDAAWVKITEGVYKGFSIGGRVKKRNADNPKIIEEMSLVEISVVDRPCNPEAVFTVYKADGIDTPQEPAQEAQQAVDPAPVEDVAKVDEQPAAEDTPEAPKVDEVQKGSTEGIWDAARAMDALTTLASLMQVEEWEKEQKTEQIAALNAAIEGIKAFIHSELKEHSPVEIEAEKAAQNSENVEELIEKVGRKISSANMSELQKIHDACAKLGAKCSMEGVIARADMDLEIKKVDDLAKAEMADKISKMEADHQDAIKKMQDAHSQEMDSIKKVHSEQMQKMEELAKKLVEKVTALESLPMPMKGVARAVAKGEDMSGKLNKSSDPKDEFGFMKSVIMRAKGMNEE